MYGWKNVLKARGTTSKIVETNDLTTPAFVKQLRNKLNMSQRLFAKVLGVSEKTIEKWEQGTNPVKGTASKLLYLLDKNEDLINQIYMETDHRKTEQNQYIIKLEKNNCKDKYYPSFDFNDLDFDMGFCTKSINKYNSLA